MIYLTYFTTYKVSTELDKNLKFSVKTDTAVTLKYNQGH